jgi:hypothetical protein
LKLKKSYCPISFINTRDCFAYDLIVKKSIVDFEELKYLNGEAQPRRGVVKLEYFFDPDNVPENYNLIDR